MCIGATSLLVGAKAGISWRNFTARRTEGISVRTKEFRLLCVAAAAIVTALPAVSHGQSLVAPPEIASAWSDGDLIQPLAVANQTPDVWAAPVTYLLVDAPATTPPGDSPAESDLYLSSFAASSTCPCCAKQSPQPNPCAAAYKGVFYANDFSYLKDPDYHGCCFGDCWKLMPVDCCGRCSTVDVGGQLRMRYHHEIGMGQDVSGPGVNRFEDTDHDFALTRLRLYTNWKASRNLRFYVEGIFADVTDDDHTYLPRPIDRNFGDFLNLFTDVTLSDGVVARVGRQELLYGAERLISPLDWGNTRRTFDGVRLLTKYGDWAVDGFYTYVVPVIPNELDEPDYEQPFYGTWATYAGMENRTVDLYYIGYDNQHPGMITSDFSLHTLGSRLVGEHCDWLYEMEGGVQFGRQSGLGLDQDAGFATAGLGRRLAQNEWKPTVWVYYDYASGNAQGGDFNRFNQLFPLAHKYLGFIDAVQRSNIESPNVLLTLQPHTQWNLLLWYYHFMANQASDIVPSNGGTPTESTNSKDFGDEIDVLVKYTIDARSNVLLGWSHFWRGNKITAPEDADFFYAQWELNF
jgi:hypothetical protein